MSHLRTWNHKSFGIFAPNAKITVINNSWSVIIIVHSTDLSIVAIQFCFDVFAHCYSQRISSRDTYVRHCKVACGVESLLLFYGTCPVYLVVSGDLKAKTSAFGAKFVERQCFVPKKTRPLTFWLAIWMTVFFVSRRNFIIVTRG